MEFFQGLMREAGADMPDIVPISLFVYGKNECAEEFARFPGRGETGNHDCLTLRCFYFQPIICAASRKVGAISALTDDSLTPLRSASSKNFMPNLLR